MKTIDEMLAVMQAAKEGKEIQKRYLYPSVSMTNEWVDFHIPDWNWGIYDYRVKPVEPKRVRLYVNEKGCPSWIPNSTDKTLNISEFIELTPEVRSKLGL